MTCFGKSISLVTEHWNKRLKLHLHSNIRNKKKEKNHRRILYNVKNAKCLSKLAISAFEKCIRFLGHNIKNRFSKKKTQELFLCQYLANRSWWFFPLIIKCPWYILLRLFDLQYKLCLVSQYRFSTCCCYTDVRVCTQAIRKPTEFLWLQINTLQKSWIIYV